MLNRQLIGLGLALAWTGCGAARLPDQRPTGGPFFTHLMDLAYYKDSPNSVESNKVGKLPARLEGYVEPKHDPDHPNLGIRYTAALSGDSSSFHFWLNFLSLTKDRICFSTLESEHSRTVSLDLLKAEYQDDYAFLVEAHDSLKPTRTRTAMWPDGAKSQLAVEDVDHHDSVTHKTAWVDGEKVTLDELEEIMVVKVKLCGPAPVITPKTRFLTVTVRKASRDDQGEGVLLWALTDDQFISYGL